jgi:hypothetical protein
MERIRGAANSRLMRLAQKKIVAGALLLDRVANSHLIRTKDVALVTDQSTKQPGKLAQ